MTYPALARAETDGMIMKNSIPTELRSGSRAPIMAGRHLPELDGVRGVAICLVLLFHCSSIVPAATPLAKVYVKLASVGWIGVDLFFVLSGFLITAILLDTFDNRNYFRGFYTRRILRIFPLYFASVTLWTVTVWLFRAQIHEPIELISTLSYWCYLQNWLPWFDIATPRFLIHFWSLAVEEQFYLLWPILIRFAAKRGNTRLLCAVTLLLAVLLRAAMVLLGRAEAAFYLTFARVDGLAIGAMVAVLFKRHGSLMSYRRTGMVLCFAAGGTVLAITFQQQGFYNLNPVVLLAGVFPLEVCFGAALVVLLTSHGGGVLTTFCRSGGLRFVGRISYGIYVFHWPIMLSSQTVWPDLFAGFWLVQITFLFFVSASSIVCAYVSFRYFEFPILRKKTKWAPLATNPKPTIN